MTCRRSFATVCVVLALSSAVSAESGHATDVKGRFAMQPTDGGMLRLDTQTGAMSFCKSDDDTWACERIEDDSAGLAKRLTEVERENRKLRSEIKELRSGRANAPVDQDNQVGIPDEKDVDRAFTFLDGVLKRFKDMVEDLRSERSGGTPL